MPRVTELLAQAPECLRRDVIAVDVAEQILELVEGRGVEPVARALQAVLDARKQPLAVPTRARDADYGDVEPAALDQGLQGRINLAVREISGRAEQHERINARRVHRFTVGAACGRSACPPNS